MNKYSVIAAGLVAGAAACLCAPAFAHGGVDWSVTVQSQPYYQQPQPYYQAPPPVFYPDVPYVYGPPPTAFPPPPPPVYYQYQYQERGPDHQYRGPHGDRDNSWRERDRREHQSRPRGQDNDRPGERTDLRRWGYGDHRR